MENKGIKILSAYLVQGATLTMPQIYPIFNQTIAHIVFYGSITGLIALTVYLISKKEFHFFSRKISLKKAAITICEKTNALDKFVPDTKAKLSLAAYEIIGNIPVYGRDPLLSQQKEIENPASRFGVCDDLNGLYFPNAGAQKPEWVDIMVKRSSLNKMIKKTLKPQRNK